MCQKSQATEYFPHWFLILSECFWQLCRQNHREPHPDCTGGGGQRSEGKKGRGSPGECGGHPGQRTSRVLQLNIWNERLSCWESRLPSTVWRVQTIPPTAPLDLFNFSYQILYFSRIQINSVEFSPRMEQMSRPQVNIYYCYYHCHDYCCYH